MRMMTSLFCYAKSYSASEPGAFCDVTLSNDDTTFGPTSLVSPVRRLARGLPTFVDAFRHDSSSVGVVYGMHRGSLSNRASPRFNRNGPQESCTVSSPPPDGARTIDREASEREL
jgi:hypothetical protein